MRLALCTTLVCVFLLSAPGIARAEGFLDLYGAPSTSVTADVRVSETTFSGTTSAAASIDLSSSEEGR